MRIVHYVDAVRLEEGGVVRAVVDLCGALAASGHEIVLLTFDDADVPPTWASDAPNAPEVVRMNRRAGPLGWFAADSIEAGRAFQSTDVAHLHVPWDPTCRRLAATARRMRVPYVVGLHGMLDDWCMAQKHLKKRAYLALGGRRLLEQAAAVHCTAEAERDQSEKWYPRGRSVTVPLICDLAPFRDLPGPELARRKLADAFAGHDGSVLLFLSRLHPKKGLEALIQAAGRLRDRGERFKLLIAGSGTPGYERSLRRAVERQELSEHVIFVGFVSGREKISLYEAADLFVLPTSQENWGFVLVEALACARPVITTRGVDIWPELRSSGGAVLVDANPASLADAIRDLLADAARCHAMGQAGRAWVMRHLDRRRVIGLYEKLYREALGAA